MKRVKAATVAFAMLAATPGAAQESIDLGEILAQMPKELGGAPVRTMPDNIVMYYLTGPSGEPIVVGVSVAENQEELSPAEIRNRLGESRSDVRKILRESMFTTPKWPGAATHFVDYEATEFRYQTWTMMSGKVGVSVVVTYDDKRDSRRAEALVAKDVFGGAVVNAPKPAK